MTLTTTQMLVFQAVQKAPLPDCEESGERGILFMYAAMPSDADNKADEVF